ncbi:ABC transporter ATP-binding protein, partial [Kitasatospora sp. NPDC036755]
MSVCEAASTRWSVTSTSRTSGPGAAPTTWAEGRYREEQAALTALAGDLVAGLGVLNGLGG